MVRPLTIFPAAFETEAKKARITPLKTERIVLNNLLGKCSHLSFVAHGKLTEE
jgi:hypothetical protein